MPGIDRFGKTLVVNCTMGNERKEGGALIEITPETVTGPALVTRLCEPSRNHRNLAVGLITIMTLHRNRQLANSLRYVTLVAQ